MLVIVIVLMSMVVVVVMFMFMLVVVIVVVIMLMFFLVIMIAAVGHGGPPCHMCLTESQAIKTETGPGTLKQAKLSIVGSPNKRMPFNY
jgi:hypothetical protein